MSPSEAHDSAYNRTPDHDLMVVEVYEDIKEKGTCDWKPGYRVSSKSEVIEYEHGEVECERLYSGRRTFFADVAVYSWSNVEEGSGRKLYEHHLILEVKPKIYSSGAALRQVKQQQNLLGAWMESQDDTAWGYRRPERWGTVAPVFRHDDPELPTFIRMIEPDQLCFTFQPGVGLLQVNVSERKQASNSKAAA